MLSVFLGPKTLPPTIVTAGDSLTAFNGNVNTWAVALVAALPTWNVFNVAIGGQTTAGGMPTWVGQAPFWFPSTRLRKIFVAWIGTNDFGAGTTGATALANLNTICAAQKAAGATTVVVTIIPNGGHNGAAQTQKDIYNAGILANASGNFDVVANPCLLTQFDAQADCNNTTYYNVDTTHLVQAGQDLIYGVVGPAILSLL